MNDTGSVSARITTDNLAESVASGVPRAIERRVDLNSHVETGKSILVAPWITAKHGGADRLLRQWFRIRLYKATSCWRTKTSAGGRARR